MTRYHPWRAARHQHANVPIDCTHEFAATGIVGDTDGRSVRIHGGLTQAQRRCVLTHELVHIERGTDHSNSPYERREERTVDAIAARRLISIEQLVDALVWTRGQPNRECAWELWVDRHTLKVRIQTLTDDERAFIDRELERRHP